MKHKLVPLGDYIDYCDERNEDGKYTLDFVRGISIDKKMIFTKANMDGVSLKPYKLFKPKEFCFVPVTSRNGNKITISMNYEDETYIVSSAYEVFKVKDETQLLPDYLFLLFSRPEFDRYARFHSWGSARESFSYAEMCRVQIPLPSIEEQQKAVNAWKAFREIKEQNEAIAAPLMQVCQSYIQELKHKYPDQEIGRFIEERKEINSKNQYGEKDAKGVNTNKEIQECKRIGDKLNTYKIVYDNDIVFNANIKLTQTSEKFAVGLYHGNTPCIVTNFYTVMNCKKGLIPEFLMLWLSKDEFARYVKFMSCSSIRDRFSFDEMKHVPMPIPSLDVQRAIVNIYNCANEAKKIAEEADRKSREVCPALIQQVIHHSETA